jgi:putative intracellular protease/amidase
VFAELDGPGGRRRRRRRRPDGNAPFLWYWEFTQCGYQVEIASPDGGALQADSWSDPRDASEYSAEDLLSLGFLGSQRHTALVANSLPLAAVDTDGYDSVFLVGGQGPMYTFCNDERVHGWWPTASRPAG